MNRGFTLVEVLIAVVLVGIAIAGLLEANGAFTRVNGAGLDLTTAEFLTDQIRELTAVLPVVDPETGTATFGPEETSLAAYDDVDDFNGRTFSPPIDAGRNTLTALARYSQVITVDNVSGTNLRTVVGHHSSTFYRVTVRVLLNGLQISSETWMRTKY
jgi:MSHA pilin protein MshD